MSGRGRETVVYRDDRAALEARLSALEAQVEAQARRRDEVTAALGRRGYEPREVVRRRLAIWFFVCAAAVSGIGIATHRLFFHALHARQRAALDEVLRQTRPLLDEREALERRRGDLILELSDLQGRVRARTPAALARMGTAFLAVDYDQPDQAWVMVGGWACRRGRPAMAKKAREKVPAALRPRLEELCEFTERSP
jgi:hypothetical protein